MQRDLKAGNGVFTSIFGGKSITSNDIKSIQAMNNAMKGGATYAQAWQTHMKGATVAAKQQAAQCIKNKGSLTELTQEMKSATVASKAATVGMNLLATAGNMIAFMAISKGIELLVDAIDEYIHAAEITREKSSELTDSWVEENSSIDDSISKYKELREKLRDTSLTASEVKDVKEELLVVQQNLIDKYGQEALGIDLVNGKYDEQIAKLKELSKQKAQDYVAENYSNIQEDEKYVSEKVNLNASLGFKGTQARPDDYSGSGFDLGKYLERYDKLDAKVVEPDGQYGMSGTVNLVTSGTREEVYEQLSQLFNDLSNDFGESNEDVNKFKETLSGIIQDSFDTEQMEKSKDNIKKYAEAQILSQDGTRKSYEEAALAVDKYNEALVSGKGVDEAKANLDSVKESVTSVTSDISGASYVFDDIYSGINFTAEKAHEITKAFENNTSVKEYAEQLKGLSSEDLLKIDFEDNVTQAGEEAFSALMDVIGLSEDEVQALIDKLVELGYVQSSTLNNKTDNLSFTDLLNSSDYKDIKEKLLDVAKSGEITEETLSSTEEYNKLLEETGTSADSAKNQILDMLSAQEKLSAATQGLNKLKSAYEEFKDEDIGFVTAQTLESLPDSFKKLGGFDSFSQIVGDPTSGTEAIQQAFNDIVKQYLISQDTLSQLVNASKHEIQSYIANLKQMGITNADEVVNQTINVLSQENELINEASDEYYKAYVKYLDSKDKADLSYVESVASKSSQLSNALGQPYQTDYNNWCELLKKKAEAYNNFITKLGSSFDKISIPNAPYSEEGLNKKKAEAIINNAKGKKVLSWDELNNASTKNTIGMIRNLGNVADYSKEQVEAAEEYLEALKTATEYKNTLKLDLSAIDTNFTSSFSPDVSSGKDTKDSKESFDFIEIAISRLTDALDKLKTKADDVYSTWGTRNASLADAINKTKTAIQLQSQAYSAYMEKANSVGLPSYYKTLVQNGAIKISDISDETLKDQISEYQNWYEKAQDCLKTQNDLNDELNELKSQKFDDLKTQYDDIIGRMEASKDLLESQITLLSSSGDYNSLRGQQRAIVNGLKEELASLTKEFNSSGVLYGTEKWYDLQSQIDDVKQQIVDAEATLKDIDNLQFDNIKEAFDFDTTVLEHGIQMIQNKIDLLEMKGQFANESYYNGMIQYAQKELDTLIKERSQLQNILNNTLYKQGTSEWNDMYSTLMDIDEEIDSMTSNLTEFNNAIRDLNWDIFEYLEESINRITDETDYLIELLSKEDLYDKDNGNLTKYADAAIALHATAYDTYKQQAQDYYEEVQDLQRQLVNGAGKDVLEYFNKIVRLHQDSILSMEEEKKAILDLIEEGYNAQLEALEKIIDKKKESLNVEKD